MKLHTSKPWFLLSAILLLAALSFTSCSKEDEVMNLDNIGSQLPGNMIKYVDKYQEAYEYDEWNEDYCFGGARIKSNIYDKEKGYGIITFWDDVKEVSGFGGNPVSIVLPEGVVSIGDDAFLYSDDLSSITLPKSLREIGKAAFSFTALVNVVISNSVESIGSSAFRGCRSLKTITLPTGINTIPAELLNGCTSLTDITIPSSVTSIEMNAFGGCSSLSRITIPSSVTSIVEDAFAVCSALESIVVAEGNSSYDSRDNCNAIIEKSSNTLVAGCRNTSIPSSVEHLGNYAFYGAGIKSIVLPDSLISIGEKAFVSCDSLKSITMGKGMPPKCSEGSFSNSTYTDATLFVPAGFKETYQQAEPWGKFVNIVEGNPSGECGAEGDNVIWNFNPVTGHLVIEGEGRMKDYDNSPFDSIGDIKSVDIREGVTGIGDYAFYNCTGLISLTIPTSVKLIGNRAFQGCVSITSLTIPTSVETIGNNAFFACHGVTSITIPNSVTNIGENAFLGCSSLECIVVAEENRFYDSRDNCNAIIETSSNTLVVGCKSTVIPGSVTSIGDYAFYGCNGLTSISFHNSVTSIGRNAFDGCENLTSISIPESIVSIGQSAFNGCNNLETIEMQGSTPPSVSTEGLGLDADVKVIIPAGSLDAYRSADGWKDIVNIVESNPTGECGAEGNNVIWNFDPNTGLLVIEGKGRMKDYSIFSVDLSPFSNSLIKKVEIKDGVTSLGGCIFFECTNLSDVTLPLSLTSIGRYAFSDCKNLASITIPNSVTNIEYSAFSGCDNLTSITIPSSVTNMGSNPFKGCSKLANIKVAEGNTAYDSRNNCNAIIETSSNTLVAGCKSTIIPNSVTVIGEEAFRGCDDLTSISIPSAITSIGERAFYDCANLVSVTISDGVKSIGGDAFHGCSKLATIEMQGSIPPSVGELDLGVDTKVIVPAGSLDAYRATDGWKDIVNIVEGNYIGECGAEGNNVTWNFNSNTGNLIIEGKGAMADYAYYSSPSPFMEFKEDIVSVEIKEGVTSVGMDMFMFCSNLKSIEIPESVTTLGSAAFEGCSGLANVNLPNSLTNIGSRCFFGCTSITEIVIPDMVSIIENQTFHDCVGLTNITLSNSVKEIGDLVFYGCSNLSNILLPSSLTSIGVRSFEGCSSLTDIVIPFSVTEIGLYAFSGCSSLVEIIVHAPNPPSVGPAGLGLDSNVKLIVPIAHMSYYKSANGWKEIANIVENENSIGECGSDGDNVVWHFNSVTGHLVIEGEGFMNTNRSPFNLFSRIIKSVEIGYGVTSVSFSAFEGCTALKSITIPNSVIYIEAFSFSGCTALTSITIPSSVTDIGIYAFQSCNFTEVICNAITPPRMYEDAFSFQASTILKVPASSQYLYEATDPWNQFGEIVGF